MIHVERLTLGEFQSNCFFVTNAEDSVSFVVDPGAYSGLLLDKIEEFGAEKLQYILLSHGHHDHIAFVADLKQKYPLAKIVIGEQDAAFTKDTTLNLSEYFGFICKPFTADILVTDGTELPFGSSVIKVMATPGHTAGSVCYFIDDSLFTGDTIMKYATGRMDFPTGNRSDMLVSISRIAAMEGDPVFYCGHGENTSLQFERVHNNAMRKALYDDLFDLY